MTPAQHVVLLKFPSALTKEQEDWARQQIRSWPERIGGFRQLRFGADPTGARTQGYQYLLFEEFDDLDALKYYLAHPVHREFLAWVVQMRAEVLAFDYPVTAETDFVATNEA